MHSKIRGALVRKQRDGSRSQSCKYATVYMFSKPDTEDLAPLAASRVHAADQSQVRASSQLRSIVRTPKVAGASKVLVTAQCYFIQLGCIISDYVFPQKWESNEDASTSNCSRAMELSGCCFVVQYDLRTAWYLVSRPCKTYKLGWRPCQQPPLVGLMPRSLPRKYGIIL